MPYNSLTSRADVEATFREAVSDIMFGTGESQSAALNLFQRLQVPGSETRFPIWSALPDAYWVDGDTGLKQTTEAAWANKYIYIEKLASIVPIPDSVLQDSSIDLWGVIRPKVETAIARKLDAAIFFGAGSPPASFPDDITTAAVAADNVYARGTNAAGAGGIAEDINQLMGLLLDDGYSPTAFVGHPAYQTRLRSARGSDGQLLTDVNGGVNNIWGLPTVYPMPGLWPAGTSVAELFALQRENFILGVRGDFEVAISNDGVIHDGSGVVQYNAFQQDMTLFRIVFRVGWQVSNPINYSQPTEADRYPAAVLRSPAS